MDPDIVPTTPAHISLTRTQSHLGVVQVVKWILADSQEKKNTIMGECRVSATHRQSCDTNMSVGLLS